MSDDRKLTDEDTIAVATELKRQLVQDFRLEVGMGVLALVKKALIWLLLILAVYGVTSGKPFPFFSN